VDPYQLDGEESPVNYDELVARCLGNLDFADRILQKFQHHFEEEMGLLEEVAEAADAERVARIAHRMKGAAANAAAPTLRDRAAEIERLGRARQLPEIPRRVAEMREHWTDFVRRVGPLRGEALAP
jgi:HPt (histidine-containing phosphotransfer) domain-containing protein